MIKLLRSCIITFLLLFLALTFTPMVVSSGIEEKLEAGLGSQVVRELERQYGVTRDPALTSWVESVGRRIAVAMPRDDVTYRFKILNSEDINAVAVPGGHVYVTKGLLRFIESEDELATVLGHEVGHIAAKHSNKQIKTQILTSLALSSFKNQKYSSLVGGARLISLFTMLKFSRDHELEADELGLQAASSLGYDPSRMTDFFRRLDENEKHKPSKFEVYLMTHPTFRDRMTRLNDRPEMKPSVENYVRVASGLQERGLVNQARSRYDAVLALDSANEHAVSALSSIPRLEKRLQTPTGDAVPTSTDDAISRAAASIESSAAQLEKKEQSLRSQLKSTVSTLSRTSSYVNPYDPVQVREFNNAVDAVDRADRVVDRLRLLVDSSRNAGHDYAFIATQSATLGDADAETRKIADLFTETAPEAMAAVEDGLTRGSELARRTGNAISSVDFAIRQFQGSLLMPSQTGITLSGLVEAQISNAVGSIRKQLRECDDLIAAEEKSRSAALKLRVELLAMDKAAISNSNLSKVMARYFGTDAGSILRSNTDTNSKTAKTSLLDTYESANILLKLVIHDLEREIAAAR